ncbi:MAG: DUF2007 domain-containing protein [Bacteroidetes bacterium]|nr:DUF2007 domain-containing protein [Bacteroidota bacterium]MDA1019167.1 DUF2007 domain-containing protein [Bacteroidota bacterium]
MPVIKIYEGSFVNSKRVINELELNSIFPIVKNELESARLAGFGVSSFDQIKLFVFHDEVEKAKNILNKLGI